MFATMLFPQPQATAKGRKVRHHREGVPRHRLGTSKARQVSSGSCFRLTDRPQAAQIHADRQDFEFSYLSLDLDSTTV